MNQKHRYYYRNEVPTEDFQKKMEWEVYDEAPFSSSYKLQLAEKYYQKYKNMQDKDLIEFWEKEVEKVKNFKPRSL